MKRIQMVEEARLWSGMSRVQAPSLTPFFQKYYVRKFIASENYFLPEFNVEFRFSLYDSHSALDIFAFISSYFALSPAI